MHQFDHDVDELKSLMAEKEAALDSEDHGHDLLSVQALLRQHQALEVQRSRWGVGGVKGHIGGGFFWSAINPRSPNSSTTTACVESSYCSDWLLLLQRDLAAIGEELGRTREEGRALGRRYAQVQQSLADRMEEVEEDWAALRRKAEQRSERLNQAETAQAYLAESRELVYDRPANPTLTLR